MGIDKVFSQVNGNNLKHRTQAFYLQAFINLCWPWSLSVCVCVCDVKYVTVCVETDPTLGLRCAVMSSANEANFSCDFDTFSLITAPGETSGRFGWGGKCPIFHKFNWGSLASSCMTGHARSQSERPPHDRRVTCGSCTTASSSLSRLLNSFEIRMMRCCCRGEKLTSQYQKTVHDARYYIFNSEILQNEP